MASSCQPLLIFPSPGKASTISGWGGTKAYTPLKPVKQPGQCGLKETIVKILKTSDKKCSDFLGDSSSTTSVKHQKTTKRIWSLFSRLCAWAKGTDSCQGDSGGPLTVAENGKTTFGLISLEHFLWLCVKNVTMPTWILSEVPQESMCFLALWATVVGAQQNTQV